MFEARHARLAVALATAMVLIAMPAAQAAQPKPAPRPVAYPLRGRSWFPANGATHPSARSRSATAYDTAEHRTVLFGGATASSAVAGDTWLFDGATRTWTQAHPATSPPAREDAAMAYDGARHVIVMFGGRSGSTLLGDTWTWDGANWTQLHPASSPPAGGYNVIAYDDARARTVLYGEDDGTTWLWDGVDWTHASTPSSPGPRTDPSVTYDRAAKVVVLFGGRRPSGGLLDDTWFWNGATWSTTTTKYARPLGRERALMSYDPALHRPVLFGGVTNSPCSPFWLLSDTWYLDTGSGIWIQLQPGSIPSPLRSDTTLVNDPANRLLVMFGGYGYDRRLDDTWVFANSDTAFRSGVWTAAADGGVFTNGSAHFHGSMGGTHLNRPIVGMAGSSDGYYLVASDGGIFTFGNARYYGSTGGQHLNQPIVGMSVANRGKGYYLLASDGGVFTFGKAFYRGSAANVPLTHPVVGMATSRAGYWIVTSTGRVFAYGNLRFHGSVPTALHQRVVGIAALPPLAGGCDSRTNPEGYWVAAANGRVYAFGDARPYGGAAGRLGPAHIVAILATPSGNGYWLAASDGRVFSYGDASKFRDVPPDDLRVPVVGAAPFEHVTVRPR